MLDLPDEPLPEFLTRVSYSIKARHSLIGIRNAKNAAYFIYQFINVLWRVPCPEDSCSRAPKDGFNFKAALADHYKRFRNVENPAWTSCLCSLTFSQRCLIVSSDGVQCKFKIHV